MPGQVAGKVALVTGAASGIGRAIAELLAQEGASVIVADREEGKGREVVAAITRRKSHAIFMQQDVTDESRWEQVIREIGSRYGRLDTLVASAGIAKVAPVVDLTLADWRLQNSVNLDGVFLAVKHSLPLMRGGGGGSIVLISSTSGLYGTANMSGYCASKGGVRLFAKAVALKCAHANDGVRVNSVHPGNTATPMLEQLFVTTPEGQAEARASVEAYSRRVVPLGRPGLPEEVAAGELFLASDASSYLTGAELAIDGGRTAGPFSRQTG
ncbi:glucose 1-dehydrogenase [Bradyrhizobium sp. C-145]|uniref:SDR family NAD(P)-dependent oxidoreductase n=1 Tax=Bradyrhizobium sp. C-145 TaxID=574727 RepID=UPI00201B75D1|nr:glucose 1-dehydrogenase [Bradyrhizobium sp. C-145]UQR61535.1 glucose 1-dehydrogenase [Bradyrhizobium sp. C-145]